MQRIKCGRRRCVDAGERGWLVERIMMRDKEAAPSCGVGVFIVIEEAESLSGK